MTRAGDATPYLPPPGASLEDLADAVDGCRGCPLWEGTTQGVFGEGPAKAKVVLVGEQPGDREDIEGRPFVGPAGRELDKALAAAQGLLGRDFRVTRQHGELVESPLAPVVTGTIHPSAVLRARDEAQREEMRATLTDDLRGVATELSKRFAGQRAGNRAT